MCVQFRFFLLYIFIPEWTYLSTVCSVITRVRYPFCISIFYFILLLLYFLQAIILLFTPPHCINLKLYFDWLHEKKKKRVKQLAIAKIKNVTYNTPFRTFTFDTWSTFFTLMLLYWFTYFTCTGVFVSFRTERWWESHVCNTSVSRKQIKRSNYFSSAAHGSKGIVLLQFPECRCSYR